MQICITVTTTEKKFFCYVKHQEDGLKESLSPPPRPEYYFVMLLSWPVNSQT